MIRSFRGFLQVLRPRGPIAVPRTRIGKAPLFQLLNNKKFSSVSPPHDTDSDSDKDEPEAKEEAVKVFSAEEELIKWDPHAHNPLNLQVTFEDVSMAVYKIRSGKLFSFLSSYC